jgi:hypothetical protein
MLRIKMFFVGVGCPPSRNITKMAPDCEIGTTMAFVKSREMHRLHEPKFFPTVILGYAEVLSLPFGPELESTVP